MSLNEVNRQLEDLLKRIQRMKKEDQLTNAILEVDELRIQAQDPDNRVAAVNKTQDVRNYELVTKAYKEIKMKGDALRDAGKAEINVNDPRSIERLAMKGMADFESSIEPKKLAVLKEFKARYSEEELIRIKEEEKDSYVSKIEQNEKEINESSNFLKKVGKFDISEYEKNSQIVTAIDQLQRANEIINDAVEEMNRLRAITPVDLDAINAEIAKTDKGLEIAKEAKGILSKYDILDAQTIFNPDGTLNSDSVNSINSIYRKDAESQRDLSAEQIKQNLQKFMDNSSDPLNAIKTLRKCIPTMGADIPDDFTKLNKTQIKKIIEGLLITGKNMDLKSTQNHKFFQKIDEIDKFLNKLYKEKGLTNDPKDKKQEQQRKTKLIKSGREYRKQGTQLDDEYRMKNFWERRKQRQEYILQTMNPETPFKRARAFLRSFSIASGYGYALSEARRTKETQYTRKEEAFKEAYKLVKDNYYSPEQARIEATKGIDPDKLSGEKKAQMEER